MKIGGSAGGTVGVVVLMGVSRNWSTDRLGMHPLVSGSRSLERTRGIQSAGGVEQRSTDRARLVDAQLDAHRAARTVELYLDIAPWLDHKLAVVAIDIGCVHRCGFVVLARRRAARLPLQMALPVLTDTHMGIGELLGSVIGPPFCVGAGTVAS